MHYLKYLVLVPYSCNCRVNTGGSRAVTHTHRQTQDEVPPRVRVNNSPTVQLCALLTVNHCIYSVLVDNNFVMSIMFQSEQRPLMIASKHGHSNVVEFLLSKEANPNAVDKVITYHVI